MSELLDNHRFLSKRWPPLGPGSVGALAIFTPPRMKWLLHWPRLVIRSSLGRGKRRKISGGVLSSASQQMDGIRTWSSTMEEIWLILLSRNTPLCSEEWKELWRKVWQESIGGTWVYFFAVKIRTNVRNCSKNFGHLKSFSARFMSERFYKFTKSNVNN